MRKPRIRRRIAGSAFIATVAVFAGAGCRSVLGVDGYGTLPPDSGSGARDAGPATFTGRFDGNEYTAESCRDCIDQSCSGEATACTGEPACQVLSGCLSRCDAADSACRVKCNLSTRRTSEMSTLMACAATNCGSCAAAHPTFGGLSCEQCLEQRDSADLEAFSRRVDALELESCQADCPPSYEARCACDDYASGSDLLTLLRGVPLCKDTCQTALDWSCLGSVKWPRLADMAPPLSLHVGVADVVSLDSLVGASVSPCAGIDTDCSQPGAVATVQGQFADLLLARSGTGVAATSYFGALLVSWADGQRPDPSSVLLSFFPPLRRTPAWTWRRLVPRSTAEGIVKAAGIPDTLDWDHRGGIVWSVAACNGISAPGLTASLDTGERAYYLAEGQALDPKLEETTTSGLGAFINLTPGPRTLELRLHDGRKAGSYPLYVRQGATTTLSFTPAPDSEP